MIEFEPFVIGLTKIGIALRKPYDPASLTVYHDVIGPRTNADEWERFVAWALAADRWRIFTPTVPDLQDALREFRGQRPVLVEATEAYDRVIAAGVYSPEGGTSWNYRAIKESCGDAAAEAFLAAGGNSAFATTWGEDKRRERFVSGYSEAVREEPMAALLPAGPTKLLAAPVVEASREEAVSVIGRLRELTGMVPASEIRRPVRVEATPERLEALRRQAAEIQS